jgi:hypothetical protein
MPMTCEDILNRMKHSLGKSPDSRHSLLHDLNHAGRELFDAYEWTWKTSDPVNLPAVADQNWIALPLDFNEIQHVYLDSSIDDSGFSYVQLCSLEEMLLLRQNSTVNINVGALRVHFPVYHHSSAPDTAPQPRVLIHPTPEDSGTPTLTIVYGKQWRELTTEDTDAIPNIHPSCEGALVDLACALAIETEKPESPQAAATFRARYEKRIDHLKGEDGTRQQNLGPMRGGADDRPQGLFDNNVGTISFA